MFHISRATYNTAFFCHVPHVAFGGVIPLPQKESSLNMADQGEYLLKENTHAPFQ